MNIKKYDNRFKKIFNSCSDLWKKIFVCLHLIDISFKINANEQYEYRRRKITKFYFII